MIKFFKRLILYISIILLFLITYLSVIGIETKAFNSEIKKNLKNINKDLDTELNSVKIIINPFKLQINIKTLGPKILLKNQSIQLESIKSQIPILSLIKKEFSSTNLFISTKSIKVNASPDIDWTLEENIPAGSDLLLDAFSSSDSDGFIKQFKWFIDDKFINFTIFKNENEINIFFDKRNFNLIGWQTIDIYQNLNITYISALKKNLTLKKNIFKLPSVN